MVRLALRLSPESADESLSRAIPTRMFYHSQARPIDADYLFASSSLLADKIEVTFTIVGDFILKLIRNGMDLISGDRSDSARAKPGVFAG